MHVAIQLQVQDRVGMLADLKEQIEDKHMQLEKQLLQQLEVQELLRCTCPLPAVSPAPITSH